MAGRAICVILARGGSKGLPDKNILNFCGLPLITHTIIAAEDSGVFSEVIVSSDDARILQIAKDSAVTALTRPAELASDTASSIDALRHVLEGRECDSVCLLQPTSPLRNAADVKAAYDKFLAADAPSLFSVFTSHASPYFNIVELQKGKIALSKSGYSRRQDAPEVYQLNGAIYFWKKSELLAHKKVIFENSAIYIMPEERSVDIDTKLDFEMAEFLYKKQN